jgi:hypothetical protein
MFSRTLVAALCGFSEERARGDHDARFERRDPPPAAETPGRVPVSAG